MAIGGIFKGIGRIADEIADVPEHVYKQALKDADLKQPPVATSIDDTSEQIGKLSDEEFSALIKEFDQSATPPPLPVAQVDEVENMTDEEFLATLKSFKTTEPSDVPPLSDLNDTVEALHFLQAETPPSVTSMHLAALTEEELVGFAHQLDDGLIDVNTLTNDILEIAGDVTIGEVDDIIKSSGLFGNGPKLSEVTTELVLAGKGPKGGPLQDLDSAKQFLYSDFNDLDDLQVNILSDEAVIDVVKELEGISDTERMSMRLAQHADNIPDRDLSLPFSGLDPRTGEIDQRVSKTLRAVRGVGMERIPELIIDRLDLLNTNPSANMSVKALAKHITDDEIAAIRIDLTEQEMAAVEFYTYRGDTAMNPALREGLVEPGSALDATVQEINRALDKLPNREAVVYRQEGAERFAAYEVGEEITADAFSSFTLSRIGSKTWKDAKANPFSGKKTVIVMQSKTGKYIAPLTHQSFEGEHEVLYKAGQRFRVIDKDEATKQVFLEEVE